MNKERKLLLWSLIFVILYLLFDYFVLSNIDLSKYIQNQSVTVETSPQINMAIYATYVIGIIYYLILILFKNIDLNKHKVGILIWSIIFFILNIVSGILGFIAFGNLKSEKKEKRELPIIEDKEFTNKYICLLAFIICMILMFVVSDHFTGIIPSMIIYLSVLLIMIIVFFKQLVHDFKYFKEYFREYMSLTIKTWLKSLVVLLILGIIIQLLTNTSQSNNQEALQKMFNKLPIITAGLSIIYAPFAEELLFRGVIRKLIKSKYLFILVSGILFGLLHVIDDSKTFAEFLYVIVYSSLGIYLASLYYKTNNLWTNITFHFLQNTLGVLGMILLYFLK